MRGTHGYTLASARPTRACRSTTRSKAQDAFVSTVASAGHEPPQSSSSCDARLERARVPRRATLTYPALALGTALVASVPGGARADETAVDDTMVAALDAPSVVDIPPEVGLAIDAGTPGDAPALDADSDLATVIGDVTLTRYFDEQSGYSVLVPNDWARDQPMANTPEFHPVSEYGGRRFRVEVAPVGRVPGGGQKLKALVDSDNCESCVGAGFESPESYAAVEATKFAPVKGTRAAEVAAKGPGGAVSEILASSQSADGRYYYYEYRTDGIYPLRFFGVAAIGPGQVGGARKLSRRDIVKVTCQVPEKDASEADYELLRAIARSFRAETATP